MNGTMERIWTSSRSDLYIVDDGAAPPEMMITKRIGVKKGRGHAAAVHCAGEQVCVGMKVVGSSTGEGARSSTITN